MLRIVRARYGAHVTLGRIVLLFVGALTAIIALALTLGGAAVIYAYAAEREDGYFMTRHEELATPLYALVSEELDIHGSTPDWLLDQVGEVRISARPESKPAFVGIGPSADVGRYLGSVPHTRVVDLDFDPFRWDTEQVIGAGDASAAPPGPPGAQDFWAASASGDDELTVEWDVESGEWAAVVMNADASRNVQVVVAGGAKSGIVLPLGIGLLVLGLLFGAAAVVVIRQGLQRAPPPAAPASPAA
jgi:hypothetical protein